MTKASVILGVLVFQSFLAAQGSTSSNAPLSTDPIAVTQSQIPPPPPAPQPELQTLYAPLAGVDDAALAELVLNNGAGPVSVKVTIYTQSGDILSSTQVVVPSMAPKFLRLSELLPKTAQSHLGMLELTYNAIHMQISAQITLLGRGDQGSIDIPIKDPSHMGGLVQNAAWWIPRAAESDIAIANTSDKHIVGTLAFGSGERRGFELTPKASRLITYRRDRNYKDNEKDLVGYAETVRLEYIGPPGSLMATGSTTSVSSYSSSCIIFFGQDDHHLAADLSATNFPLSGNEPRLVLANVGEHSLHASPTFFSLSNGSVRIRLDPLTLSPHSVTAVDLAPVTGAAAGNKDLATVGVTIASDGRAGDLIGALTAADPRKGVTHEAQLRPIAHVADSTGSYPIRWGDDYSTVIAVTNVATDIETFEATIAVANKVYRFDKETLSGGETKVFDLNALKSSPAPEFGGASIPPDARVGRFHWMITSTGQPHLIGSGRILSSGLRETAAFEFPCYCGDSDGPFVDPDTFNLTVGQQADADVTFYNGEEYVPSTAYILSNDNPSVCSYDSQSGDLRITALSPGTCNLAYNHSWTYYEGGPTCGEITSSGCQQQTVVVQVKPTASITGGSSVPLRAAGAAGVNSIGLGSIVNPSGGSYSWAATSGGQLVSLQNVNSDTVTVSSVSAGQATIQLTYTVNGQSTTVTHVVNVQQPTFLQIVDFSISGSDENTCQPTGSGAFNGCGVNKTLIWQVADQSGQPIQAPGMELWDRISVPFGSTNTCGLSSFQTTCTSSGLTNAGPCGQLTGFQGRFSDFFNVCSTACFSSPFCTTGCETDAQQTWNVNGFSLTADVKSLQYFCNIILVNGH